MANKLGAGHRASIGEAGCQKDHGLSPIMNDAFRRVISASDDERRDVFLTTARRLSAAVQNVEKDFWVCWTLDVLFNARGMMSDSWLGGLDVIRTAALCSAA